MNKEKLQSSVDVFWDNQITPALKEYIKIPNKSPSFDPEWKKNGHMDRVLKLATEWAKDHLPSGAKLIVKETEERTPLILIDVPGERDGNILMYGHLDKQPEMEGWNEGMGPWDPVMKDEKLYGRGGADDGYAMFASLCALNILQEQSVPLPRVLILIEFCEESGSPDLPHYMDISSEIIGSPDLVICLDSGAGDYKRFWTTTSLRGLIGGTLKVDVLTEGIHSGASGFVPSSFRVIRKLLSRIEDEDTGSILLDKLKTKIPNHRINEVENLVSVLEEGDDGGIPWKENMSPSTEDSVEGWLRLTWKPALSVVGADGLPLSSNAGNVLRPFTQLRLSMRIPPLVDHLEAQAELERALTLDPPYGAKVTIHFEEPASGWNAPETASWLADAMNNASEEFYGEPACSMGEGGTIPFMAMLGEQFPKAQFVITGVLGPGANAHGPNEFLHIPYAKKLTACVASILNDFPK